MSLMFILQIVLVETTAPLDTPIVLERIPADLNWKFECNLEPGAPRYWVKLKSRRGGIRYCVHVCVDYMLDRGYSDRNMSKIIILVGKLMWQINARKILKI